MTNYQLVNYGTATKATSFANFPVDAWVQVMGDKRYKQNELYARVPWVYAAADLVASAVMTVPTYFVRGETVWKNGDEDAPPVDWFNDWSVMAYRIVFSALNYGAGYANNEPMDFRWLATPSITEEMDVATGRLRGFRRQVGSKQSPLIQPEDIVHFWWFKDPMTEIGRAKIYPAKVALGAGDALNAYTILLSRYADSGAVGVKLLQSPMPAKPDEAQELKTRWSRIVEGVSKAFGSIVLNPDAKVMTLSDKLSEFYDHAVIQDARRDVEAAFGLPETMLNQAANLATKQADQVDFYTNVVAPICDWLATTVNRQAPRALRGYRLIYRVNEVQAMQRDENEVADSLMKYVAAGYTPEVASDLLGIDLTDEQRAALRETQTAPEEIILERTALGGVSRRENLEVTQGQAARALEIGQLERWVQNRLKRGKSVDPDDFTAETLTADEVKAIVERETGAAEDNPFQAIPTNRQTTIKLTVVEQVVRGQKLTSIQREFGRLLSAQVERINYRPMLRDIGKEAIASLLDAQNKTARQTVEAIVSGYVTPLADMEETDQSYSALLAALVAFGLLGVAHERGDASATIVARSENETRAYEVERLNSLLGIGDNQYNGDTSIRSPYLQESLDAGTATLITLAIADAAKEDQDNGGNLSTAVLVALIAAGIAQRIKNRADLIGENEAGRAVNAGQWLAAVARGGTAKKWLETTSKQPRQEHLAQVGVIVGINDLFPDGSRWSGEKINCKCGIEVIYGNNSQGQNQRI